MAVWRAQGLVDVPMGMRLLFRGLEGLERMVAALRATGESPAVDAALLAELSAVSAPDGGGGKKA